MENHKTRTKLDIFKKMVVITLGAVIFAVGLEGILIPNDVIDGGVVGIALMLSKLTSISLGVFLFVLNIPFFILGYKQIGKTFLFGTLYGVIILSVATTLLHNLPVLIEDQLLAPVFGGIMLGIGVGLVIRNGGVLDGTETLAILVEKKTPFTVGEIIMVFNLIIFSFAALVFNPTSALYSILTYYIAFKTIDLVVKGFDDMKSAHIVSNNSEELAIAISNRLGRGVTFLNGEGSYSKDDKRIILAVFTRLEEAKMKDIIHDIDPEAFIIITDVAEVRGGRFKKKDIH